MVIIFYLKREIRQIHEAEVRIRWQYLKKTIFKLYWEDYVVKSNVIFF